MKQISLRNPTEQKQSLATAAGVFATSAEGGCLLFDLFDLSAHWFNFRAKQVGLAVLP